MFDLKVKRNGYAAAEDFKALVEGIGEILGEEFAKRDAEIKKLRADLETERRLRLGMKSR